MTGVQTCALPIYTLIDMEEAFGKDRAVAVFKELTKLYESVYRGTLESILDSLEHETVAGEYVIIKIGRASCRERVYKSGVASSLNKRYMNKETSNAKSLE